VETFGRRTRVPGSSPPRGVAQETAPIGHPLFLERTELALVR